MGRFLNPGNETFGISLTSDIYVDKTELISFTNSRLGKENRFLCVSRPRRFGKSMTAGMLAAYYGRNCDSKKMFEQCKIAQDPSFLTHLNKYHVLFFDMQRFLIRAGSAQQMVPYLEKEIAAELKEDCPELKNVQEQHLAPLLEMIYRKNRIGYVFIIDEWDCIFREEKENKKAQKEYLDFLRDLFKGQTYVRLAYMTGILPIKKYGMHSALNIFDEFSMTNPKRLAKYVGFTESEVKRLCDSYHMDFEEARRWYDGYCFRNIEHIYNPKSIVDAMLEGEFHSYWTSTETYEALRVYIDLNFDGLKDAIIAMLGEIGCKIDTGTFQNDMTSFTGRDDVLALLVHLGYLAYREETEEVFIPNEEVRAEFLRSVNRSGWKEVADAVSASEELLEATLQMEGKKVAEAMDAVHTENTSILSYNNENSLSCAVTLAYYSAKKNYILIRELPAGKGFADIVFLPRRHTAKPAFIVELKWDKTAEGAIRQIKDRKYMESLKDYEGNLLLVGINYDKKTKKHQCVIETSVK